MLCLRLLPWGSRSLRVIAAASPKLSSRGAQAGLSRRAMQEHFATNSSNGFRIAIPSRLFAGSSLARAKHFDADEIARKVAELLSSVCSKPSRFVTRAIFHNGYRRYFLPDDRKATFHRIYDAKRRAVAAELGRAPQWRVLDVGGGYGRVTGPFAERHDVTLLDISADMLAEAKERFPALKVMRGDARKLPFKDGAFDIVIALDLLCHLPDLEEGLRELCRVTRPGGPTGVRYDESRSVLGTRLSQLRALPTAPPSCDDVVPRCASGLEADCPPPLGRRSAFGARCRGSRGGSNCKNPALLSFTNGCCGGVIG